MLADHVHDHLGVGHDGEGFEARVLGEEDLVAAVGEEFVRAVFDLVAEQHGLELDAEAVGELSPLADEFQTDRGDLARLLFDEYPDVADFFRHDAYPSV